MEAIFAKCGMSNTSYSALSGKIITTKADLMKFNFMLHNNGKYAGKQVLSPAAANNVVLLCK